MDEDAADILIGIPDNALTNVRTTEFVDQTYINYRTTSSSGSGTGITARSIEKSDATTSDNTLSADVEQYDNTATLISADHFPSAGGLWLGPNGLNESWGYATYTGKSANQLTGLTRDIVDNVEYTGEHTSGAVARFWWPLDTATAEPVLRETMDSKQSSVSWELQLSGISSPVPALRTGHLVVVQKREISGATWGSWTNYLVGWTMGHTMKDDASKERPWTLTVSGLQGMLLQTEVTGLKVGPPDMADNANINVSSTLSPAYKEADTGEFTSSNPTISANSMADNNVNTSWISGRFVGGDNVLPTQAEAAAYTLNHVWGLAAVTQLHINKYTGQSDGYRWIEVSYFNDSTAGAYLMAGVDYFINLDSGNALDQSLGDRVIFAENPTLFAEENPDSLATRVLDLANLQMWRMKNQKFTIDTGGATGGTFTLTVDTEETGTISWNTTDDNILSKLVALSGVGADDVVITGPVANVFTMTFVGNLGRENGPGTDNVTADSSSLEGGTGFALIETVVKGTPYDTYLTGATFFDHLPIAGGAIRFLQSHEDTGTPNLVWGTHTTQSSSWTGDAVAVSTSGQTMRMVFFPGSPSGNLDYWSVSSVATPGYNVESARAEWVYFDLPTMGLTLNADIDASVMSIVIAKEDEVSVDGLPSSGTIQIGLEQIDYSSLNRSTGEITVSDRGVGTTTAVGHTEGDTVYFVNSGVATEAYPIDTIEIERPAGFSVPENFVIRGSELSRARKFDEANYHSDYISNTTVTLNTDTSYSLDLSGSTPRIRYLLIEVTEMTGATPSRVKINEIRVMIDGTVLNSNTFIASGTIGAAMDNLASAAGIPTTATSGSTTGDVVEYTTETNLAWPVLVDLAAFSNSRITVERDSKIAYSDDPSWSISGIPTETSEFTRAEVSYVETNKMPSRSVGQVVLTWRSLASDVEGTVAFPADYTTGRKVKIGPYIYANTTAAMDGATKRYYQLRRPYDMVVELAQQGDDIRAGSIRGVNWQLDDSQLAEKRTYIVLQSAHAIKDFGWNSVLTLLQLNRTDER
jgi:hypothetical protein